MKKFVCSLFFLVALPKNIKKWILLGFAGKKYALLTAKDPKVARAYGEELLLTSANAPLVLKSVGYTIFDGSDARVRGEIKVKITGEPDYDLARMLLTKSLECSTLDQRTAELLEKIPAKQ